MYLADGSCHVPTPTRPISAAVTEDWRRHYYAAVSWIDHQVGRVLGTLTEIGLEEETIVIFHGDHVARTLLPFRVWLGLSRLMLLMRALRDGSWV